MPCGGGYQFSSPNTPNKARPKKSTHRWIRTSLVVAKNTRCSFEVTLQALLSNKQQKQMAGHKIAHATLKGPSVVKEIIIGLSLGLVAGGLWKMHHWNEQRKIRAFYDMLEKGEIGVVVEDE